MAAGTINLDRLHAGVGAKRGEVAQPGRGNATFVTPDVHTVSPGTACRTAFSAVWISVMTCP